MSLRLIEARERDEIRVRVSACDCDDPTCEVLVICTQLVDCPKDLWLTAVVCPPEEVDDQVELLLGDEPSESGLSLSAVIGSGLALIGLPWAELQSPAAVQAQLVAFKGLPGWMGAVPVESVWACREWVFGPELTKMPRALWSLHRYYVVEGPAGEAWIDA